MHGGRGLKFVWMYISSLGSCWFIDTFHPFSTPLKGYLLEKSGSEKSLTTTAPDEKLLPVAATAIVSSSC